LWFKGRQRQNKSNLPSTQPEERERDRVGGVSRGGQQKRIGKKRLLLNEG